MAEVLGAPLVQPNFGKDEKYVYFHSGSEATYRKVAEKPKSFTSIPTIDISDIDSPLLEDTFKLLERFFKLDLDTKMDAHVQKNPAIRGYEPMGETRLDPRTKLDIKEAFTMGDCFLEPEQNYTGKTGSHPPSNITMAQNIWPSKAPWWRDGLYAYYNQILPLSMKLVRTFALAFDLDETAFDEYFKFPITGMRALYYPPTPVDENSHNVGLGAHSDFSWLTLVLQDNVPALEVLNEDGIWVEAPPQPNTFVCNVGQYLERQTNGKFPATVHRVRNKTGLERYSLPFFLTMDPDVVLDVLDCCKTEGEKPKYEPINVGDLYIRRVLPARQKHPTSIKYSNIPENEWKYDLLLS
ncbi:putative 2og-fe oxygenase [Phaeomoniella chlamydospora]|uniref:Putative 2og-fe oxygenase n=1 Tax=Phaeomoniella chlamydospora TaxID=158046 RepID=A0A0G2E8V2_PHACM|nr:putative 2og-fe oxygenase [Phaeomoniella chlamydospora]